MRPTLLVIAALFGAAAFAQAPKVTSAPTDQDLVISESQLETILQNAPASKQTGKPGSVSSRLFDGSAFSAAFIRLNEPDKPHVHAVSEIFVVRDGAGTLETGGTLIGPFTGGGVHHDFSTNVGQSPQSPAAQSPSHPPLLDRGGTAIEGGRTQKVKAGDVVLIPAGVNHTWIEIEQPVVYVDIKFLPKAN